MLDSTFEYGSIPFTNIGDYIFLAFGCSQQFGVFDLWLRERKGHATKHAPVEGRSSILFSCDVMGVEKKAICSHKSSSANIEVFVMELLVVFSRTAL